MPSARKKITADSTDRHCQQLEPEWESNYQWPSLDFLPKASPMLGFSFSYNCREGFTQELLHTAFTQKTFTQRCFYPQKLLHTEAFYAKKLLHRNFYTHKFFAKKNIYTEKLLHEKLIRTDALHTVAFTPRSFCTDLEPQSWSNFCRLCKNYRPSAFGAKNRRLKQKRWLWWSTHMVVNI